jgi:hypothetical protein
MLGSGNDRGTMGLSFGGRLLVAGDVEFYAGPGDDSISIQVSWGVNDDPDDIVVISGDLRLIGGPGADGPGVDAVLDADVTVVGVTTVENFEELGSA